MKKIYLSAKAEMIVLNSEDICTGSNIVQNVMGILEGGTGYEEGSSWDSLFG